MAVDCSSITELGEALEEQMTRCEEAMERWIEISVRAEEIAQLAEAAAGLCLSGPDILIVPCLLHAGLAREVAEAVAEAAEEKAVEAAEGYLQAFVAKMEIDGLAGHCDNLESWQEEAAEQLQQEAYAIAGAGVQAECDAETADLSGAEDELDEALASAGDPPPPDFG